MPRIIGDAANSAESSKSAADFLGLGCNVGSIQLDLGDGKKYVFDQEKAISDALLKNNAHLRPAIVMLPSGLSSEVIFAQCSFPSSSYWKDDYEEISGINNFLRKGSILIFMRVYSVTSLITTSVVFAQHLYKLAEPRIQQSLFVVDPYFFGRKAMKYDDLKC